MSTSPQVLVMNWEFFWSLPLKYRAESNSPTLRLPTDEGDILVPVILINRTHDADRLPRRP